jgi:hypothetical protein
MTRGLNELLVRQRAVCAFLPAARALGNAALAMRDA